MKRKILLIMLMLGAGISYAQIYQQTDIELDSEIPKDKSIVYEASTSIKLLKGFCCKPKDKNSVMLTINRYGVFPPDEGIVGGTTSGQDGVVGFLPGELNVGNLGAAVYSIPLLLPHGLGKMTPEIAISYNNQAGNGLLGWAWDLSGLSSINRVGQTLYHDDNHTAVNFTSDRFMMDGKRLMLCSGNYGGNSSIYKTEMDETSKITAFTDGYNGPARFLVYKKDGTRWEYGYTDDSRVEVQNKNDVVLKWLVNKIMDPDGNYISFHYDESQSTGESYINSIDYTLNDNAGIQIMYRIDFLYEDKEDYEVGYVYGGLVQNKKLLKSITIRNMMTGAVLYDYSFDYLEPGTFATDIKFMYHRLKSIGLTAGDMKLNPTIISWNKSSHYPNKFMSYSLNQGMFNKVPFVGDFNGDGYSDVITVPYKLGNAYPANVQATVLLNNGDGTFQNESHYTFSFDKTLEWIYVVDFNGDGLDDVVPYYVNYDANSNWKSKFCVYINRGNTFSYWGEYSGTKYFMIYPGDFFGNKKISLFLEYNATNNSNVAAPMVCYCSENNAMVVQSLGNQASMSGVERVVVEDINGDGRSEIIYLMANYSAVAKLSFNNTCNFIYLWDNNYFDSGDFLFPGDFNGDGYTDFLKYDNQTHWSIVLSDGHRLRAPVSCINNNLLRGLALAPYDIYKCSLRSLSAPTETIRIADFDGDGKSDIGVFKNSGGNYYLEIGFKPYEKSNNNYDFRDIKRFYFNINYAHQYVHLGNFLGHENVSILGSVRENPGMYEIPKIVSLNTHSSKYSVERITDGMGNSRGFRYKYMMPDENFYTYEYQWLNSDLRTVTLPIKALYADTAFSANLKPCITRYSYKNALYHTKGHGLLGFKQRDSKLFVNNTLKESNVYEADVESLSENFIILPQCYTKYNSNNQIISKEQYFYNKYSCIHNDKVIMPLLTTKKNIEYDPDSQGSVLKSNIQNIDYHSDVINRIYSDVVNVSAVVDGVDANYIGYDASSCEYWNETNYTYNNSISNWIVERVQSIQVSKHNGNNEVVGMCEIMEYSDNNPYHVTKITTLPNAEMNYTDPLKIVTDLAYDAVGHVVMQAKGSPSAKNHRIKTMTYAPEYNYRFPTTTINENGWEVNTSYDSNYGNVLSVLDYNQFETESCSDPFEITFEKMMPDGTKNVSAKRWAKGNKHAPKDAVYYYWTKTTGNAENLTFFNKKGNKLRDVTFGLNGEAVYIDFTYDDYGNVASQSMPYIADDDPQICYFVYDQNNRLIEEIYPNGLVKNYSYNHNQRIINTISPEGVTHEVVEVENPMGWRIQTVDIGGNSIDYEYYSDGKLKSATIDGNEQTKIDYEYDGRRNMSKMKDPALGEILYNYNAFDELIMMTNAKNCVTTYNYDNIGNMIGRVELDEDGQNAVATQWVYENKKGKIGMLSSVTYGDSQNIIYDYDDLLRIVSVDETINGKNYQTMFTYDDANRVTDVIYPNNLAIQKQYSNSGYYKSIRLDDNKNVLWKAIQANASGYVVDYQYGNGVKTQKKYDAETNLLKGICTSYDNLTYQNLSYSYDGFGNLVNRSRLNGTSLCESFTYDEFNRLVETKLNDKITGWMEYDEYGNILSKYVDNHDGFYNAQYSENCPYAISNLNTDLEDEPWFTQDIDYTTFDKIKHIVCGNNSLSIDYGFDYTRKHSVEIADSKMKEKVYVSDCEYVNDNGKETVYTFLKCPTGVFAVCCTDDKGNNEIMYVHKDHLDSWCMITDKNGKIVQKTSYDAWGNPRNESTWAGEYNGKLLCDRGFTGHEHLLAFGIINMNGRAYDPFMSMMMSPDDFIQTPDFSQNYNRYIYCYNNPLSYSDPSGEFAEWLIYGIFNGIVNVICDLQYIDNFQEGMLAFGAGFVSGCLTQGLSECSWAVQVVGGVAGTTIKTGTNSFVQQNTGSGLDWSLLETKEFESDMMYALGSSLAKSVLTSYVVQPDGDDEGKTIANMLCHDKYNQRLLVTASKKMVGNLFSGRKIFDGFGISKKNMEDVIPYLECALDMVADNVEISGRSETLGKINDRLLNFDFKGVMTKFGSDANYCYSQFRSLFVKNGD